MSQDITAQRRLVDELREADRRKSEFIAVLSHELRNPLAAIRTTLYVLEHGTPGSTAVVKAREVIDRQVGHVVRMVDDLLDVTRISRNKVELQRRPLDLTQVVRETIQDNRSHLELGGVRLEVRVPKTPVMVSADGARISQVITNLLSNAIKFSRPGRGGRRLGRRRPEPPRQAILRVSDAGAGIDPVLIERLFEPFMQGDDTLDRNSGGLGLGLALVKGLVELHGGEVSAYSAGRNQGAELTVRLPLQAGLETAALIARTESLPQPGRRVLIVDDDRDVAEGLRAALEIHTHRGRGGAQRARGAGRGAPLQARRRVLRHRPAGDERLRGRPRVSGRRRLSLHARSSRSAGTPSRRTWPRRARRGSISTWPSRPTSRRSSASAPVRAKKTR